MPNENPTSEPCVDSTLRTCVDCRYVSITKRPRIVDATGFDDQMEFADDDEDVYHCRAFEGLAATTAAPTERLKKIAPWVGTEIGPVAKRDCPLWAEARKLSSSKSAELDALLAASAARAARVESEG